MLTFGSSSNPESIAAYRNSSRVLPTSHTRFTRLKFLQSLNRRRQPALGLSSPHGACNPLLNRPAAATLPRIVIDGTSSLVTRDPEAIPVWKLMKLGQGSRACGSRPRGLRPGFGGSRPTGPRGIGLEAHFLSQVHNHARTGLVTLEHSPNETWTGCARV